MNIGWLGLQNLKRNGGCGYFPRRLVERQIAEQTLFVVPDAPVFELPAWVIVREDRSESLIDPMVSGLVQAVSGPTAPRER